MSQPDAFADAMSAIKSFTRWGIALVAAVSAGSLIAGTIVAKGEERADVELVLLADASYSMDPLELQMQRTAYVEALRDPIVMRAIQDGKHGKIVISFVEFHDKQMMVLPPTWIRSETDLAGAALAIERAPMITKSGNTAIGDALLFARGLFTGVGERRVIDVSGDGEVNSGTPLAAVDLAGIQVNGLPIGNQATLNGMPLDLYYDTYVVRDGFLIPVERIEDMAIALRAKLVREIANLPAPLTTGGAQ